MPCNKPVEYFKEARITATEIRERNSVWTKNANDALRELGLRAGKVQMDHMLNLLIDVSSLGPQQMGHVNMKALSDVCGRAPTKKKPKLKDRLWYAWFSVRHYIASVIFPEGVE